ncbi:acyltransferase [Photobacterium atrarenae]|uniref:Acyltransferase n=1 Tax=Photobacterium atrarenae TaxID=865757 RepID=A0ABY5GEZ8_9GAMM|nr:acyltransferase [Photobacterium atrarenae]UTV27830.1 acyltransferase [Photobacterium atrarenae]
MREKVVFFDVLRCVAAVAVVTIHVLGPYREQLGVISDSAWSTAVIFNSFSRWAVPIFIMITGALMLSDTRPFEPGYYLRRRLGKVLIPFLVWSLFYAGLSGLSAEGYDAGHAWETLKQLPVHETYYHLGFFYYFIPLYFVVPFLRYYVQHTDRTGTIGLTLTWLVMTTLYLMSVDGLWSEQLILYSGYLLLGYCLFVYRWPLLSWLLVPGIVALLLTAYMVISHSMAAEEYTVGRWLSYKTLNTALIAALIFALCRYWSARMSPRWLAVAAFVSRYSLGIYLLHPIFLWPVRAWDWYFIHPLVMIPCWTLIITALALGASWLLARSRLTAWLVP